MDHSCEVTLRPRRRRTVIHNLYSPMSNDPDGVLFDRDAISPAELAQIGELFGAMGALREAERRIADASQRYMKLNATSMRAIHVLMVAENAGELITPTALAEQLGISTAAVAKMVAKLEADGHVLRRRHPTDRRAQTLTVSPSTRTAAMDTVGRTQSSRMRAAAALSAEERAVVIRFLQETAEDLAVTLDRED